MNNRKICFWLLVVCILLFGAIIFKPVYGNYKINYEINLTKQYSNKQEKYEDKIDLAKYYSCEKVKGGYEISLYNGLSEKVYSQVYQKEPTIRQVKDNILEISISVGSPASYNFYFNIENCDISVTYFNSVLVGDYYIAYMDKGELVLSNIFDEASIYMRINRDFTKTANPMSAIISIELIEQENIRLKYFQGKDYVETTEIIELKN